MIDETLRDVITAQVGQESKAASRRWGKLLDPDDIEQELWLWVLENESTQSYLHGKVSRTIRKVLKRKADLVCAKEKIDYEHFHGTFIYSPANTRSLLEKYFSTSFDSMSVEERIDLEYGLDKLGEVNEGYRDVLIAQFLHCKPCSGGGEQKRRERAVDKLASLMNRSWCGRSDTYDETHWEQPKQINIEEIPNDK